MTELKSANEFLEIWDTYRFENRLERNIKIREFVALIQKNAIEAALSLAAENAELNIFNSDDGKGYNDTCVPLHNTNADFVRVSILSITSLKNHEKLKV